MKTAVRMACEAALIAIPLDRILPTRKIDPSTKKTTKYRCIESSIKELGLIEPLVVHPKTKGASQYLLLDGHVRHQILVDLGISGAKCLIATDDEAFTYNHKVNRLTAIQEHFMILRAIQNGVSEARIARTLNVDISKIRQKRDLLEGVCAEAVELLRDKHATAGALRELRKVKPMRQIEIAELMCAIHNFTVGYAKCLVISTEEDQMVDPTTPKEIRGLSAEDISRMEHETEILARDFKVIEQDHGKNMVSLVVLSGYLKRLFDNSRVSKFLHQRHPEVAVELQKIMESKKMLDGSGDIDP
ncbi:plasmid partitioning protein RepB C-terminal domain-containing protein [Planctomicrobium sp. SH527]|uniref:plasmid partitioning protein RepB C-terminal domain-containing protein n=1 Tax=Planctomicrobium sp. SH527 TaxID=3448123 RepID=UPI003F5C8131